MTLFKPKKHLGQHFLQDPSTAQKLVKALSFSNNYQTIIELGPGVGALTSLLAQRDTHQLYLVEVDPELVFTEGTIEGGIFHFRGTHFEWLLCIPKN